MLDKRTETMLEVASTLTAEDLDGLRASAATMPMTGMMAVAETADVTDAPDVSDMQDSDSNEGVDSGSVRAASIAGVDPARGERERLRTRESKISTVCVGRERERHDWWPVGTELVGHMGSQAFTATVVENRQVKSGRSILITSGPASGKVCLTPTRAAIEATEAHRQAHNLGRGGGVTNGWDFWQAANH